ncbi:MAG TPA: bifunctional diguanylate cyclase/phosphodiesterase, partial [Actinomycetes bacterium]
EAVHERRRGGGEHIGLLLIDLDRFKEINDTLGYEAGDRLLLEVSERLVATTAGTGMVARLGGDDPDLLLRRAEVAMYQAKAGHGGVAAYEEARDPSNPDRLALVGELRAAIDGGALTVTYQPKLELASSRIVGAEALARWPHPTRGAVVAGLLAATGLPPSALTLEVTEGQVMTDFEQAVGTLRRLHDLGVHLAVDDFGTGYSSLGYLRELPVDEVKIDKSFVFGMATSADDEAIVEAAVTLGHILGLRVVSEGVNDDQTQRRLTAMGCDVVQGFHIGRPMPPDELLRQVLLADRVPSRQRH